MDNSRFEKLINLPSVVLDDSSDYCNEDKDQFTTTAVPEGCELIIRAYKLGYAKDLGECEPKKVEQKDLQICIKRRQDEPYFHFAYRKLASAWEKNQSFFQDNQVQKISDKFHLQLEKLELLRDYQAYSISAAPRASHHIWTNLPYPNHYFIEKYKEIFRPNHCVAEFQNQTNTIPLVNGDTRKNSKLLEHVYGQLLFNPKNEITVGFCKEYKIHWNAPVDMCDKIASDPVNIMRHENILDEVEIVLKRYRVTNELLNLEEQLKQIDETEEDTVIKDKSLLAIPTIGKQKNKIVTSKIAKDKEEIRKTNEIVSFQCLMQQSKFNKKVSQNSFKFDGTRFNIKTRNFHPKQSNSESQVTTYRELSQLLESDFRYSRLTSRSDISVKDAATEASDNRRILNGPSFLFSRLDILNNVDIFLGNEWVLERDDLIDIYPYHVHLKNYVKSFRTTYKEHHGRL